ncbi:BCCT family transporter [Vreelandella aquamarina]|jgi:choline-glycine betaine transporter|uniref:Choline-glycine betaine transporter n=1 Tax=Vreelandella aquamarina TaxID=77097 RepID=A0A1N6D0H9_9GAMM|nr:MULTISPECIES: BCCT family transporter [Halomonas]KTG22804.1 BCCT transporter [Idiomarina sp. H105]OAF14002.1 BCCT transporter [Idiomarina sp. WRN-38]MDC8442569.1 BCCT family transporter [Halomonas aquamarina]SIN64213.1 Choline-glycine betaine transporter [Halomonas meridiana]SIN73708.1 Choline-glycine betaine transporter [Halomonas meridiana]
MNQPAQRAEGPSRFSLGDPIVLVLSIGFIVAFLALSFYDIDLVANSISAGFAWTALVLGSYFQLLLLLTFFIAIGVALTPAAKAKIGNLDAPEMSTFKWLSIILCTLLAGGGVFFAAGEPVYHFVVTPPAFDTEAGTAEAVSGALAQSFMHWGFMAWAVLGSLTAVVLAHAHYVKGQPLQPRTLLYPVLGERLMRGPLGGLVDACCVIALVAGTVGPIGFLATQVSFGLHELFGLPEGYTGQLMILAVLGTIYVLSSMSGVHKGIQLLSRFNVLLALAIGAVIIMFGPTLFLVNTYVSSMGAYVSEFFTMATMTAETAPAWWMQWWTVFFFAWFIGYAPLMAIFVARISRGRSIREMILAVAVLAPIATTVWFTLLGGSGIYYQLTGVIDLTEALNNFQFDVATLTVAQALPGGTWMALAILLLTTIFVATTGDSMSYAIAVVGAGHDDPSPYMRAFWGIAMALMAAVLLYMGAGQIGALQQFIVITAIPVSLILLPSLWNGPQAAYAMAREQGIID